MGEEIILEADKLYRWEAPKRKATIFGARLGRLVLTDERLLFLSTGSSNVGKAMALGAVSPMGGLAYHGKTGHLDLSALGNEGSVEVPIALVRSAGLTGGGCLTIGWIDDTGADQVSTFGGKNRGLPDAAQWIAALEVARTSAPTPSMQAAGTAPSGHASSPTLAPTPTPPPTPIPTEIEAPVVPSATPPPAPPTRPMVGATPAGYLNPNRLATTVEEITEQFGHDVLDDPGRMRNLLRDAYGADATRERSDIEAFVGVLDQRPLGEIRRGRSQDEVAAAIASTTALDQETAGWTVSVIVRASGQPPVVHEFATVGSPGDDLRLGTRPQAQHAEAAAGVDRSRSRARRTNVLLACAAVAAIALGAIGWFVGRSGVDEWKQRAEDAEAELAAAPNAADVGEQDDVTEPTQPADDERPPNSAATPDAAGPETADADLTAANAALTQQLAAVQGERDTAQAGLQAAQAELSATQARLAPFATALPGMPIAEMPVSGSLVNCEGFGDECGPSFYLDGHTVSDGAQMLYEARGVALIPLTTPDGLTWTGQAEVIGGGYHTCNGQPVKTAILIKLAPTGIKVDPASASIGVSGYDVTFTLTNATGTCTGAKRVYAGPVSL